MTIKIWILLLVCTVFCEAIEFAEGNGIPQYRVFDAEKIATFIDTRDSTSYKILVMRRKYSQSKDSTKIVEFRLFLQPIRLKTAHVKDTMEITFYTKRDIKNVCPAGWNVISSVATGSIQYVQDSLFVGALPASSLLDDKSKPLINYSESGFFVIRNSDTTFVPGINRIWVNDTGYVHPSAYVDGVKLLDNQYLNSFLDNISRYPLDNSIEYMLPVSCMWSSDSSISPLFQSSIPFNDDGFIPLKQWH